MLDPASFRQVISGQRRGVRSGLLRAALRFAELPYAAAMRWRNRRYDRGRDVQRVEVPVISVGNLTLGGTGKTPMVEWLARWFRQRDVRVCLISRGYKAGDEARNDEALELEQKLPDVPHLQNPDRVAAARLAIEEFDTQLILLDDAFQHRRIHRDLDVVLLDALEPFGYGHVFPRGMLREPVGGLRRADLVCLTRSDAVSEETRQSIAEQARRLAPRATWIETAAVPAAMLTAEGASRPLDDFRGKRVLAFCGIGNPAGFRHTLATAGLEVAECREFPDHYAYGRDDLETLARRAAGQADVDAVICTHKDLVKLGVTRLADKPLFALAVRLEISTRLADLERRLQAILHTITVP